ncbi:MAG TPA: XRE family transcriptional regulator [Pseudonocardiaceae bacterium]|jgi:Zn-dependent peptidase ImmA (M78 family)/DNA-binding XRE family transcriptional regulator
MATDAETLGQRIAEARGRAGLTQADLAAAVSLDRSVLTKIELGNRRVSALELAQIADALHTRIEWFVEQTPEALISHRNTQEPGAPSPAIDAWIERIARDVEFVLANDERFQLATPPERTAPTTADAAEALASDARGLLGLDNIAPCRDLADRVADLGLLVFALKLGTESADAATILLAAGGVAVINGTMGVGRRRLALAHDFGHFLVADEYTVDWRVAEQTNPERSESLLDRFARALLLPAVGIRQQWQSYLGDDNNDLRSIAVRLASTYQVDMATLARRLTELGLVGPDEQARIRSTRTTRADIVEMDLFVGDELNPPALPRDYERSVLRLYRAETISAARALDLLLDTWDEDALPALAERREKEIWQYL